MTITFDQIPQLRVPFVAVEFNASQANQGPALLAYRALIIGQRLTTGTAVANSLHRVTSVDQVITKAGRGSILHQQAISWFGNNRTTELWIGVLDDNAGGVAPTGTLVFAGPATAAGTIVFYLGGERITVAVASGDASTAIATAVNTAINANLDLPVTSGVAASTVTLTFRQRGLVGNSYDVRHSYRDGEALPAGVGVTITAVGAVVAGTLNPVLTTLIANMADSWFQIWTHPYTDATSLTAIETELASRFGPLRSVDGVAITSAAGSHATLISLGNGRNSPHSEIFAQPGVNPVTPPMRFAAKVAAQIALAGAIDPARPFQTLPLVGALPPAEVDQFDFAERNLLLFDGIATTRVGAGGIVQIDRAITTYQVSPAGAPDVAYLDVTTMLTLMYLRFTFRTRLQLKYPRHKLADDGTRFGPGQLVMTPQLGKAEALGWFEQMEELGLVEGATQFKRDLIVERNVTDRNRLDFLLPPDLINQLIGAAAQIQFRL